MTAAQRNMRAVGNTTPADLGKLVTHETPSLDDGKAGRALSSKKFELLRQIMADTKVSPIAFRLACLMMWKYRNEKRGGLCCPAAETMATDLSVNEKTVRRAVKELVDGRYFKVERPGKQQSNRYWPVFGDRTPVSNHREESDWTFEPLVTGHFEPSDRTPVSKESSLEPSVEPRARFNRAPASRSTVDGIRSAPEGASPTSPSQQSPVIFCVGESRRNSKGREYTVEAVDHEERTVSVRWSDTGERATLQAPSGAILKTSRPFKAKKSEDSDVPF